MSDVVDSSYDSEHLTASRHADRYLYRFSKQRFTQPHPHLELGKKDLQGCDDVLIIDPKDLVTKQPTAGKRPVFEDLFGSINSLGVLFKLSAN